MNVAWIKMDRPNGFVPASVDDFIAAKGFNELGYDVKGFYHRKDIDLQKGDVVVGSVDLIDTLMAERCIDYHFEDFPKMLEFMYYRWIHKTDLRTAWMSYSDCGPDQMFIKPVKAKQFKARLVSRHDARDLDWTLDLPKETEVYIEEPIKQIVREDRIFVMNNRIVGMKPYVSKGDYSVDPEFILKIVSRISADTTMPVAYSIDIGLLKDGTQFVVECNDGYAISCYDLDAKLYAEFLAARFNQLFWNK